jgi:hypothetical protein
MKTQITEKNIRKLSWKTLVAAYQTGNRTIRTMILKEAKRCGYKMSGLIVADVIDRRFVR